MTNTTYKKFEKQENQTSQPTEKKLLEKIVLYTDAICAETKNAILYFTQQGNIWLSKKDLWKNEFKVTEFVLPVYDWNRKIYFENKSVGTLKDFQDILLEH